MSAFKKIKQGLEEAITIAPALRAEYERGFRSGIEGAARWHGERVAYLDECLRHTSDERQKEIWTARRGDHEAYAAYIRRLRPPK